MNNIQTIKPENPEQTGENRDKQGRFVKGVSGNPNGRPEGSISVVEALKKALAQCPEGEKKTYLELLIKRILKKGIADGDVSMIKDIINRIDGMPKQTMDVTSGGEQFGIVYLPKKDDKRLESPTEAGVGSIKE